MDTINPTESNALCIKGEKYDWEIVIGMEIHAQIKSNSKLFSDASTNFGAKPNSNVALVDAAMPGTLPVLNQFCVEQTILSGLGLNADINFYSAFDRKNYFYPDLPQGYQISQLYHPLVGKGHIKIDALPGFRRTIRIERIHLEQDAGKSIHDMHPKVSFIDLNRTGIALMEIVSYPDIRSGQEATAYLNKIRQILRYLKTCDGRMQNGNLRADVNISVCQVGMYEKFRASGDLSYLGTRCELKNMNSMRFIQQAINFEARRQIIILEEGGEIKQQTRLYDAHKNQTRAMRSKEEAHDYRYFPCPDLLPLRIEQSLIDKIAATLPELPDAKKIRFMREFAITEYDASILTADIDVAAYFEKVARHCDGKQAANWIINELFGRLSENMLTIKESKISEKQLTDIIKLIADEKINGKIAKELFEIIWDEGGDPNHIVTKRGMLQVSDALTIETVVNKVIKDNPLQVKKAKLNPNVAGWFVGQVMKATSGKANPKKVNAMIMRHLKL